MEKVVIIYIYTHQNQLYIYIPKSVIVRDYNKGFNYNKIRLIETVCTEEKDIGGYYMKAQDIPIAVIEHKEKIL